MPDVLRRGVRAADTLGRGALVIIRVFFAQNKGAGVFINFVVGAAVAEVRDGHEARDVGVIHEDVVAKAVGLIGVHFAELRVLDDAVFFDAGADLGRELFGTGSDFLVLIDLTHDLRGVAEGYDGEHVGRDEIAVNAGVVAGTEAGPGHARDGDRRAVAVVRESIGGRAVGAAEIVRGLAVILLDSEKVEDAQGALFVLVVELARAAGLFPEKVRELHRVAERIDLILALPDPRGLEIGIVGLAAGGLPERFHSVFRPAHAVRFLIERVCVGVDINALELAVHEALNAIGNLCVVLCDGQIVANLRGGITQPHGGDIAGDDEGIFFADGFDGGIHGVGVAIFEELRELRVVCELFLADALDFQINGFHGMIPFGIL